MNDIDQIDVIRKMLVENKISCYKYNYSLEESVQTFKAQEAYLQLSSDFKYLYIVNKKPNEKVIYVQGKHHDELSELRKAYQDNKNADNEYRETKSSASCYIEDI